MPDPLNTYEEEIEPQQHWIVSVATGSGDFLVGAMLVFVIFYLIGLL